MCQRYVSTDLTLPSEEETDDTENHLLTIREDKDMLTKENQKSQPATSLWTPEDKAMVTSDKQKSTEQPDGNVYFIQKIKGH